MVRERSFGNSDFTKYYDPKLGSDCNLDKGLSNKGRNNQLVSQEYRTISITIYI